MDDFKTKLQSLSFGINRIKKVTNRDTGEQAGEQFYHKDGTVSAIVTPKIHLRSHETI